MLRSWKHHWMKIAYTVAEMSTCKSRGIGAVFVKDNRLLVSGFNGVPSRYPHPAYCPRKDMGIKSGEQLNLCVCIHAEANGLYTAAKFGQSLAGSTCFSTVQPCVQCAGALVNSGVSRVIYDAPYSHNATTKNIFKHAEVETEQLQRRAGKDYYALIGQIVNKDENPQKSQFYAEVGTVCVTPAGRFVAVGTELTPNWIPIESTEV